MLTKSVMCPFRHHIQREMEILSKIGVLTKETEAKTKDVRFQGVYMCWMGLSDYRPLA